MPRATPETILRFWLEETGPAGWWKADPALDAEIRRRFAPAWRAARGGAFAGWTATPEGATALLILLDQFPRNMFRGDPRSFATDPRARAVAHASLARGHDRRTEGEARMFHYIPFEHSESLADQDRAVRLFDARMPRARSYRLHARAHREVIRKFGRFPFRNTALGRATTPAEADWLEAGGYAREVERLSA
jgi:uncharacterized protein (DUF924 family)